MTIDMIDKLFLSGLGGNEMSEEDLKLEVCLVIQTGSK